MSSSAPSRYATAEPVAEATAVSYNPISGEEILEAEPVAGFAPALTEPLVIRPSEPTIAEQRGVANAIAADLARREVSAVTHNPHARGASRPPPAYETAEVQFASAVELSGSAAKAEVAAVEATLAGDEKYARKLAEEEALRAKREPEEEKTYASGGYEVAEYKMGDYECANYDVAEYKSVYDK